MVIVGFQGKLAPSAGKVRETVGGTLVVPTVILEGALVAVAPRSSVARAVSV